MTTVFNPFMNFGSGGFDFTLDGGDYLYLPGRSGGQLAHGGTDPGDELILRGTTDANLGLIRAQSPIDFDNVEPAQSLSAYSVRDFSTQNITTAFIGGTFGDNKQITFSNAVFVYETVRASPRIESLVSPSFAAFTLFNALPNLRAGSLAGFNPLQALILNAGPITENAYTGTKTSGGATIVNATPQTKASVSGAVMTMTAQTGIRFVPTFSTVAGSTVNLGNLTAVKCSNPTVAFLQPQAGVETMTNYYGIDFDNITFGGNIFKVVVRSNLAAATNAYFLNNLGGAQSSFGSGNVHFNDNTNLSMGGAITTPDYYQRWNSGGWFAQVFAAFNDEIRTSNPADDTFTITSQTFPGNEFRFGFSKFAFGQTSSVGNQVGVFVAPSRSTEVNGEWADFLLTQAGNLTIDDTMGLVAAWVINAISLTSGTGTLNGPVATLNIGGMTTSGLGTALTHAVRVTGRTTLRGPLSLEPISPTALAADANDWQGQGLGNNAREVVRAEASGADRTITGVDRLQVNDTIYIINVGSTFNIILAHQSASSAAENRMISPTGANLTLGPDEYAFMWHDDTTNRWRILDTNGA